MLQPAALKVLIKFPADESRQVFAVAGSIFRYLTVSGRHGLSPGVGGPGNRVKREEIPRQKQLYLVE
jgi:hypothetical protein